MENGSVKCVMVLDEELPAGLQVNTAGILSFTLGREMGAIVGPDIVDASGNSHVGIIKIPIPILRAKKGVIRDIRSEADATDGLLVVDFTDIAQSCKTYEEYSQKMAAVSFEELNYLGVALYGDKKPINRLTGSLPLLR